GRGAEPEDVGAVIRVHAALAESPDELAGVRGPEREEAAERRERDAAVARNDGRIEVRGVECVGEPPDLVLTDLAEQVGGQAVFIEELEDIGRAVVAGGVVGRAGEAVGADAVGYLPVPLSGGQRGALAEPAG